jgi:hypothetical protein
VRRARAQGGDPEVEGSTTGEAQPNEDSLAACSRRRQRGGQSRSVAGGRSVEGISFLYCCAALPVSVPSGYC